MCTYTYIVRFLLQALQRCKFTSLLIDEEHVSLLCTLWGKCMCTFVALSSYLVVNLCVINST